MYLHDYSRTVPNNSIAGEQFRIIRTWVRNKAYCQLSVHKLNKIMSDEDDYMSDAFLKQM